MGISIWHLLVVLAIALVIFGTKKLRDFGGDLGGAIKSFKTAVKDENAEPAEEATPAPAPKAGKRAPKSLDNKVIEGKVTAKQTGRQKKKV
jgi:sec-independent protein translocase protein TatA